MLRHICCGHTCKIFDDSDDIFEKVSDDVIEILEKVSDDGDDIYEKVSDDAKDIREKVFGPNSDQILSSIQTKIRLFEEI